MAEEENKPAEPPKSKKGLVLGLVGGIVVLIGGAVGGAMLAPRLAGAPADAQAATGEPGAAPPPKQVVTAKFEPIIIDLRGNRGEVHHLKVGLSVELADEVTVEQFELLAPRGRAAAIGYLRSLGFKDATDPSRYADIQKQLSERVTEAVGKDKIARVLLVDFVAQ